MYNAVLGRAVQIFIANAAGPFPKLPQKDRARFLPLEAVLDRRQALFQCEEDGSLTPHHIQCQ
jgi:hypothetical protein